MSKPDSHSENGKRRHFAVQLPGSVRRVTDITQGMPADRDTEAAMKGRNVWAKFTAIELETKLRELRKLIDGGTLTDRSLEHQVAEIGIIENELAKRNDR